MGPDSSLHSDPSCEIPWIPEVHLLSDTLLCQPAQVSLQPNHNQVHTVHEQGSTQPSHGELQLVLFLCTLALSQGNVPDRIQQRVSSVNKI